MESEVPTANGENSTASANTSDVIIDMDVDIVNDEEEVIPESQPILDDDGEEVPDEDFEEMDDNFLAGIAQLERESLSSSSKDKKEDEEIRRKKQVQELPRLSPSERIFPDLRPSNFHTVAFEMKPNYVVGDDLGAHPKVFQSRWNANYVPMPCAEENTRVFKLRDRTQDEEMGGNDEAARPPVFVEKKVWMWERIEAALMQPLLSTQDIISAIKRYHRAIAHLPVLQHTIDVMMSEAERTHFFAEVLPCMQTLALDVARFVTCPLPFLSKFQNYSLSLSQKQIASLLACAFFSLFPRRFDKEIEYPTINFIELFQFPENDPQDARLIKKSHKLRCILNYFTRVAKEMPRGVVTFTRRSIKPAKSPQWGESTKTINRIVPLINGTIEDDGCGMLQVDFANKFLGGGVLGNGAVQEEILFVIYPEMLISRLFTEKLHPCEALIITGCERFSRYAGYASNFMYQGDYIDTTQFDSKGRRCTQFVAIDALYVTKPVSQFHPRCLSRELNKGYAGFSSPSATCIPVATGKWGCGAFNGDPQLKAILQLMAASEAGRDVVFFTFGDAKLQLEVLDMYNIIQKMSIKEVWNLLNQYYKLFCTTTSQKISLYEFLRDYGPNPSRVPGRQPGTPSSLGEPGPSSPGSSTNKRFREVSISKFYSKEKTSGSNTSAQSENNASSEGTWISEFDSIKKKMATINNSNKKDETKFEEPAAKLTETQIIDLLNAESQSQDAFNASTSIRVAPEVELPNEVEVVNDNNQPSHPVNQARSPNTPTPVTPRARPSGQTSLTDFYNYEKRN